MTAAWTHRPLWQLQRVALPDSDTLPPHAPRLPHAAWLKARRTQKAAGWMSTLMLSFWSPSPPPPIPTHVHQSIPCREPCWSGLDATHQRSLDAEMLALAPTVHQMHSDTKGMRLMHLMHVAGVVQAAQDLLNATGPPRADARFWGGSAATSARVLDTSEAQNKSASCTLRQQARTPDASGGGARQISALVMEEEYRRVLLDVMNACQDAN